MPVCLAWHAGRLWCGTNTKKTGTAGRVYYFRPDVDEDWTLDHTNGNARLQTIDLLSFQGELYSAQVSADGATVAGIVEKRDTLGAWSTVETGTIGDYGYLTLVEFEDALYVTYYKDLGGSNGATIRKFDGSSWSTAYTGADDDAHSVYLVNAVIIDGKLYVHSAHASPTLLLRTTDGSSWTDVSSAIINADAEDPTMAKALVAIVV
jgi:hypothetical protein